MEKPPGAMWQAMLHWIRREKGRRGLLFAAVLGGLLIAGTAKALDMFLSVDGIRGESVSASRRGWIDVTSYQLSSSRPLGATEPVIDEIVTTQPVDASTTFLFKAFANGSVIPNVVFEAQKSGAAQVVQRITLSNARVTSVRQHLAQTGDGPTQQIGWRFASIKIEYIPATGTPVVTTYP